jgi:hypothetical protein
MSEQKKNRKKFIIVVAVIALIVGVSLYSYPIMTAPTIDNSYTVISRSTDTVPANAIANNFNLNYVPYTDDMALNNLGQNIIWVGGGGRTQGFSWLQPSSLEISSPTAKPALMWNYANGIWTIDTNSASYAPSDTQKYGTITVNYDVVLHRFVIVIIGYDQASTLVGSQVLLRETLPKAGGYIIYLPQGQSMSQYQIVEEG